MGTCNKALLSYGIVIPLPKAIALLNALRKLPPPPEGAEAAEDLSNFDTDTIEKGSPWDHNEYPAELNARLGVQAAQAGFTWEEYSLESLGSFEECEGLAVFYNGVYEPEEDYANGVEVEFWGTDEGMTRVKRLVYKPWEDDAFMGPAKLAFERLAGLPSVKKAKIAVDPDWLHGICVG